MDAGMHLVCEVIHFWYLAFFTFASSFVTEVEQLQAVICLGFCFISTFCNISTPFQPFSTRSAETNLIINDQESPPVISLLFDEEEKCGRTDIETTCQIPDKVGDMKNS